ncbi:MAG: hypothetical protein BYD32DRAFT_437902 [Podila humilis]|nr:MAG: hypothetical protein BYD32DRAFT_437902 [Podila humilis]
MIALVLCLCLCLCLWSKCASSILSAWPSLGHGSMTWLDGNGVNTGGSMDDGSRNITVHHELVRPMLRCPVASRGRCSTSQSLTQVSLAVRARLDDCYLTPSARI